MTDVIEELAEAMYRADRLLIRNGTPPGWDLIHERIRRQFRTLAEDWVEERAA